MFRSRSRKTLECIPAVRPISWRDRLPDVAEVAKTLESVPAVRPISWRDWLPDVPDVAEVTRLWKACLQCVQSLGEIGYLLEKPILLP